MADRLPATAGNVQRTIDAVWRMESAKLIAALTRMVRDVGVAEDLAQDALVAALERWPETGVPDNPGAWLMAAAKRRAIDQFRQHALHDRKHQELVPEFEAKQEAIVPELDEALDDHVGDDLLRLVFIACHPILAREDRMARDEYEPQQIVADVVIERFIELGHDRLLFRFELGHQLLMLAVVQCVLSELIDGASLGGGHEPRSGVVRNARLGPTFERRDQRVLCEILGHSDVAHHARQRGDQLRRFHAPHRIDGALDVAGGCGKTVGHDAPESALGVGGNLFAEEPLALAQLGRELLAEIFRLEHLANLDLGFTGHRVRAPFDPLDCFFLGSALPEPKTGDELLGLAKGSVDDGALVAGEPYSRALGARLQSFAGEHDACFHQLLVVLPHRAEHRFAGQNAGLGILRRLYHDHESHRRVSVECQIGAWSSGRIKLGSINTSNEERRNRQQGRAATAASAGGPCGPSPTWRARVPPCMHTIGFPRVGHMSFTLRVALAAPVRGGMGAALLFLIAGASSAVAQSSKPARQAQAAQSTLDARWTPWLGCWRS